MNGAIVITAALSLAVGCTRIPPGPSPGADGGAAGCSCTSRECGDDGCGNSCGSCLGGTLCDPSGRCVGECVPDCRDRTCGVDPVCGMPCGSATCDDGNVCTADSCASGRCQHESLEGEYACGSQEGTVLVCAGGASMAQTCGRRARQVDGVNGTFGCEGGSCRNIDYADRPTCVENDTACVMDSTGGRFIGVCLRDETGATYWFFGTCAQACIEGGFTSWTGRCEANSEGREICICT